MAGINFSPNTMFNSLKGLSEGKASFEIEMENAENQLKADGGKGAIDGKLNQDEVRTVYGDEIADRYDTVEKDDKGLINALQLGKLLNPKGESPGAGLEVKA